MHVHSAFASLTALFILPSTVYSLYVPIDNTQSPSSYLYSLNNDPAGANIVAMGLSRNGTIVSTALTPTGGNGQSGANAPGQPPITGTFGSDAVVVGDDYLFAVNPGSNTLSLFTINPLSPANLTLLGSPASTLGTFPMSVAYSSQLGTVCVLNGGSTNGVACFSVSPTTGLSPLDASPRSVSPALNQTTPPLGPLSTASDLRFNPSGTALFASIKGTPATNSTGAIYAWPVSSNGTIGTTAVVSVLPNIVIDFSMTFIGKSDFHMMLTAPGLGAAILGIDSTLAVSVDQYTNITGSAATCWGVYGASERLLYAIDALKTNITVVNPNDGSVLGAINYVTNATGGLDTAITKSNIYTLTSSATSVININLRNEMQVQEFFPAVPNPGNLTSPLSGMAFWGLSQKY